MTMHYGDRNHRMRHFAMKGGGMLILLVLVPALTHVPDPERMFYLGIGAGLAGWFAIIAFGELFSREHKTRVWVHLVALAWIAITIWYFGQMLEIDSRGQREMYIIGSAAALHPLIAIGSHYRRHRRHLAEARAAAALRESSGGNVVSDGEFGKTHALG